MRTVRTPLHPCAQYALHSFFRRSCALLTPSSCAGVLAQQNFKLEANGITTVHLAGQTGRIADNKKSDYPTHVGTSLIAHRAPSYVCQPGRRPSARAASPACAQGEVTRNDVLESTGVIVSPKQPDAGTFLANKTAAHFIKR